MKIERPHYRNFPRRKTFVITEYFLAKGFRVFSDLDFKLFCRRSIEIVTDMFRFDAILTLFLEDTDE